MKKIYDIIKDKTVNFYNYCKFEKKYLDFDDPIFLRNINIIHRYRNGSLIFYFKGKFLSHQIRIMVKMFVHFISNKIDLESIIKSFKMKDNMIMQYRQSQRIDLVIYENRAQYKKNFNKSVITKFCLSK